MKETGKLLLCGITACTYFGADTFCFQAWLHTESGRSMKFEKLGPRATCCRSIMLPYRIITSRHGPRLTSQLQQEVGETALRLIEDP